MRQGGPADRAGSIAMGPHCRLVFVLLLVAACSPATTSQRAAPKRATVLDTIGTHFTSARKWFGMVHDLRFTRNGEGDLVPHFDALTSELVRRRDAAGQTLAPRLPALATGTHTVALTGEPDLWVHATERGSRAARAQLVDGVIVYRDAVAGGDLLYKLTPTHVDEYVYLAHPPPELKRTIELEPGPGVSRLRATPHSVEVIDRAGAARMRIDAPLARAADGTRRRGSIRLEGHQLVLAIDLRGLRAPVLVDPDWSTTGTMTVGHWMSAAWLLPGGDAVVAGGCALSGCPSSFARPSCGQVLADTEIWNHASGTWSAGPPLGTPRFSFASVTLDGGDLLAMGGCTTTGCDATTDAVERFDATADHWQALPPLRTPRAHAMALQLAGGDVIVAGGCGASACTTDVDRLDPTTGTWRAAAPLGTARGFGTATRLDDGRVLVAGGCANPACTTMVGEAEVYDAAADTWSGAGSLTTPRAGCSATLLGDGSVLIAGGCADADCMRTLATVEIWRPATSAFEAGPAMPGPRHDHTATRLASGQVLMAGGASGPTTSLPSAVVYVPSEARFVELGEMNLDRAYHVALPLPSDDVLIAGGCNTETCMPWAERFSPRDLPALESDASVPSPDAGPPDAGPPIPVTPAPPPTSPHPVIYRTGAPACADDGTQDIDCPLASHPLQDGDFQPDSLGYEVRGDEVVDDQTHLVWQAADDGHTFDRDQAVAHCATLATANAPAGSWRLPTVVELATLIDGGRHEPSIDPVFRNTASDAYWTATPVASGPAQGWTVRFDFGEIVPRLTSHPLTARCLRGGDSGRLQAAGPLVAGALTVKDTEGGLEWQRHPDTARRTWGDALRYCAALHLDGKDGWHLPNINELRSLVDYGSTADVRVDPVLDGVRADTYWSSTPTYGIPTLAQSISFNLGVEDGVSVDSPAYALCVRHLPAPAPTSSSSGCGCSAAGARSRGPGPSLPLVLGALLLALVTLRRGRRHAPV